LSYTRQAPKNKIIEKKPKSTEPTVIKAFGYTLFSDTGP